MGYHFFPCERDQLYLMPPALQDWLPEGDLAWFILDAVSQMNLTAITQTYRADGWGPAAYEPAMLVARLLYAYCLGERSSRRIARLCQRDGAVRVITANQGPDHTTIARFRQTHESELAKRSTQVLRLCAEAGLLKVGIVARRHEDHGQRGASVESDGRDDHRGGLANADRGPGHGCGGGSAVWTRAVRRRIARGLAGSTEPAGSVAGLPGTVDAGRGLGHRAAAGQARNAASRRGRHRAEEARPRTATPRRM